MTAEGRAGGRTTVVGRRLACHGRRSIRSVVRGSQTYCASRLVLAVAAAALARQDLRRLRHLALWAAVVSLLSLNYSVDFSGLQMNVSLIRPFPAQLVSTRGHLL